MNIHIDLILFCFMQKKVNINENTDLPIENLNLYSNSWSYMTDKEKFERGAFNSAYFQHTD